MFLVPAITMRTFSEERKNGTIELLRSLPFQAWEIVLGKFLGGFFLVVITLLLTGFYFLTIYLLGNPVGNLDVAGSIGSYIGLFMLGALFTAIGLFASSVSQNQIVSFLLAAVSCFFMFEGFEMLASANPWSTGSLFLEQLGIVEHYYSLSRGLIDLADMVYFVGMTALFILITKYIIEVER
jgi:ABC-2 type transport system permease protein